MADRLTALLAEAPGVARASRLVTATIPVLPAFEEVLPERGLRPGSTVSVDGIGRTSLALALAARASRESWTAVVGSPSLGLAAAAELGVDLDRLVVIDDPGKRCADVLASLVDSFDLVIAHPLRGTTARKVAARVRERDAVLISVGAAESDITIEGVACTWHGIGSGHGHLAARTLDIVVSGRRAAARPTRAKVWLPDHDGDVVAARDVLARIV